MSTTDRAFSTMVLLPSNLSAPNGRPTSPAQSSTVRKKCRLTRCHYQKQQLMLTTSHFTKHYPAIMAHRGFSSASGSAGVEIDGKVGGVWDDSGVTGVWKRFHRRARLTSQLPPPPTSGPAWRHTLLSSQVRSCQPPSSCRS